MGCLKSIENDELINEDFDNKKINEFNATALNSHNKYREMHNVEDLVLKKSLCQKARKKVLKLLKYKGDLNNYDNIDDSDDDIEYGQNLCICNGKLFDIEEIRNNWYDEGNKYVYDSNKYIKGTGHFTQMIWKDTKTVGFGYSKIHKDKSIFLVYYYPAGNELGKFKENVQKKTKNL